MVAAQALGIARAAIEFATDYASRREAFGGPIIENQGISFPLADLAADLDAARLLTWRAAWMAATPRAVPARRGVDEQAQGVRGRPQRATEQAVQVCGGWGYISDLPVEKWYRDAKLYTIFEGTSEIQRMVIGRALGDTVGAPPLHHTFPADGPPLSRQFGRGTPARSRAGMAALRSTQKMPEPFLRAAMKVLGPPERAPRR